MVKHYVTSFTKLIGQFSCSSCSKYGTCENEKLQASIQTYIGELHVSSPYEFLVSNGQDRNRKRAENASVSDEDNLVEVAEGIKRRHVELGG